MSRRVLGHLVALAGASAVLLLSLSSLAQPKVQETIESSAEHLEQGRVGEALVVLESAADEGLRHPELSFNRGLAYERRVGTAAERSGDWGQAAAAFAETLAQRPSDAEAERGFEEAQLAVARRNSQGKSKEGAQVSSPLGLFERALLALSPSVLFWLSAAGSLLLSLGLLLRASSVESRSLAGTVCSGIGALVFVPCLALFFARDWMFADAKMAVVVSSQANLVSEAGQRIAGRPALAESTLVYVRGPKRGLVRLVGVVSQEYLSLAEVRIVSHEAL